MRLNELRDVSLAIAKSKGWHDADAPQPTFEDQLALIVSELSEALEAYRLGHHESEIYFAGEKPEGVPVELADVVIRIGHTAGRCDFNLENLVADIFGPEATLSILAERPLMEDEPTGFGAWLCEITKTVMEAYGGRYPARALALSLWSVARMCRYYGIDLVAAVELKTAFNRTRPHRHGGKKI